MNKIRVNILLINFIILSMLPVFIQVSSYIGYVILSALILQGVKTVIDFCLGFPMQISYSGYIDNTEENSTARIIGLLLLSMTP